MRRITSKVLEDLEERIKKFFEPFTLQPNAWGWNIRRYFPKGESSVKSIEDGLTAKEAYYWMKGFLACYYMIKSGEIDGEKEEKYSLHRQGPVEDQVQE